MLRGGEAGFADLLDVAVVGPAAAAEDVESGECPAQFQVLVAELDRVALVQRLALVKLGVALGRGVGPDAADPAPPECRQA